MAETKQMKTVLIKKRVNVSVAGQDVGNVKDKTTKFTAKAGEVMKILAEGENVVHAIPGTMERTLSFTVLKEAIEEPAEETVRGDVVLTVEGDKPITYKDATVSIGTDFDTSDGAVWLYECTLPTKGTKSQG